MCYGNLDPKYMMRDIEARMKDFPAQTEAPPRKGWAFGWIVALLAGLRRETKPALGAER